MAEINNTLLTTLIKGLKYNDKTSEYTFKNKKYKLREVKETSDKKIQETHYYFVNINEPTDLKFVKVLSGIPFYDGFNNVEIDKKLRKLEYQREYYKRVLVDKRGIGKTKEETPPTPVKATKKKAVKKKRKLRDKKCAYCGETYTPKQSKQKFCCDTCRKRYYSELQAEQLRQEALTEKVCPICNKTFEGTPRERYCSKECYKLAQKENRKQRYEREKASKKSVKKNSGKKTIIVKKKNVK